MVKSSYITTNKKFQDSFQKFAGTKTKKGHLSDKEGETTGTGVLIKVEVAKAEPPQRGWYINLNGKTYKCYNADFNGEFPPYTATASKKFYKFKGTVNVEVTINKKENIYRIDKMNIEKQNAFKTTDEDITIKSKNSVDISNKDNDTSLNVGENLILSNKDVSIEIKKDNVSVSGDLIVNDNNLSEGHKTNTDILNSEIIIPGSDSDDSNGVTLQNLVDEYKKIKIELESLKKEE